MIETLLPWWQMTFNRCRCKEATGIGKHSMCGGHYYRGKDLYCLLFGHDTNGWEQRVDRFLGLQFDPTGIHWLHSHYKPAARWNLLADHFPERFTELKCDCSRCGLLFWEFYPVNLAGKVWGPAEEFSEIQRVMAVHEKLTRRGI